MSEAGAEPESEPTICPSCGARNRVKRPPLAGGIVRCGVCKAPLDEKAPLPSEGVIRTFRFLRALAAIGVIALPVYVGILILSGPGRFREITRPIRAESRKLAEVLISCRCPPEQAYEIALRKKDAPLAWWESEILPSLSTRQRSLIIGQIKRTQAVKVVSSQRALLIDEAELAILELLQRKSKLSATDCFHLWQDGLLNQPESWWRTQSAALSPEDQEVIEYLRKQLLAQTR